MNTIRESIQECIDASQIAINATTAARCHRETIASHKASNKAYKHCLELVSKDVETMYDERIYSCDKCESLCIRSKGAQPSPLCDKCWAAGFTD